MEKQNTITEEQFRAFCGATLPHLNDLIGELRKLGHHGMASFSIADDGYFSFSIHNSEWSMNRWTDAMMLTCAESTGNQ